MTQYLTEVIRGNYYYKKYILPISAAVYKRRLRSIHIEPTNACNLHCSVCFSQNPKIFKAREKGFIDFALYTRIVDEINTFNYKIDLGLNYGGESLLHRQFIDMLAYTSKMKNISVGFTTNGTLLNEKIIEAIIKYNVENIIVSVDAVGGLHDTLRSGSNIELVEENVKQAIKIRGNRKLPKISINITQSIQNNDQIKQVVKKWINIVNNILVYPCITEDLKYLKKEFFDSEVQQPIMCPWPFYYMAILWNGDVTTCCHDINGINVKGNVTKDGIKTIWQKNFKNMRVNFAKGIYNKEKLCTSCETWKVRFKPYAHERNHITKAYYGISKIYTNNKSNRGVN